MRLVAQKAGAESRGFAFAARPTKLSAMQSLAATGSARRTRRLWQALAAIATGLCLAVWARAANAADAPLVGTIEWRASDNLVDAQIEGWPLQKVLERIASRTSWHVYVEPGAQHVVSAKFKNLKPGDALRRLLGGLNFALIPSSNGPARLYVFLDSQTGATLRIEAPDQAKTEERAKRSVPNELLVTLKPGAKESIDDLAKRLGARVVGRLDALGAYRLQFEDSAAADAARAALAENSDVGAIEENFGVARPEVPQVQVAGTPPPLVLRPRAVADGSQVVIGLIDTPVQQDGTILKDFLLPGVSVAGDSAIAADTLSHGSAMATTILYGLARSSGASIDTPVRILPVDVYGASGSTTTFQLAQGILEAINGGASIINLSLGGDTQSPLLESVIQAGHAQGAVFLAATGNQPVTTPTYPAAYSQVIAVTALGQHGEIASYANRGDFVDAAAPGTSVVPFQGQSYVVVGTSTATANASAYAAHIMATTGTRGSQLDALVRQSLGITPAAGKP